GSRRPPPGCRPGGGASTAAGTRRGRPRARSRARASRTPRAAPSYGVSVGQHERLVVDEATHERDGLVDRHTVALGAVAEAERDGAGRTVRPAPDEGGRPRL